MSGNPTLTPDSHIQPQVNVSSSELDRFLSTEYGYITALIDPQPDPEHEFEWNDMQLNIFRCPESTITNKCRQSGGSYGYSARATARASLINRDWAIIITSIKRDEAQNKISYVDSFIDEIPRAYRREIKYRTKQSIEFANGDNTTAKIISHAQKPSRGLHGDALYDESDFYADFDTIFEAGQPGTRKVNGRTDVLSTPFNPFGLFRRIIDPKGFYGSSEAVDEFSEYTRFKVAWWLIPDYCIDIQEAIKLAPHMDTKERVHIFGTQILKDAFKNSKGIDSFRQEYEATFIERVANFFVPSTVLKCVVRDLDEIMHEDFSLHWNEEDASLEDEDGKVPLTEIEQILLDNKIYPKVFGTPNDRDSIYELSDAIQKKLISPQLYMSIDVGSTGHATDIVIGEEIPINGVSYIIERFWLNISGWEIPDQQQYIEKILSAVPIVRFSIDTQGLGFQMGQYFDRTEPSRFEAIPMNSANYDRVMMAMRDRIDTRTIGIPNYDTIIRSITSVRREATTTNQSKWIVPRKKGGHCDEVISRASLCALINENSSFRVANNGYQTTNGAKSVADALYDRYNRGIESRKHEQQQIKSTMDLQSLKSLMEKRSHMTHSSIQQERMRSKGNQMPSRLIRELQ